MRIIDFHSHLFSRTFFETLAEQASGAAAPGDRLERMAAGAELELPPTSPSAHTDRWLADMDAHGVEHLCTFASVPEEVPTVAAAVAHAAGRLTGFALLNPCTTGAAERVDALLATGAFRGVLLFPAMHHFDIAGPEMVPVLRVLDDHRAIAFVHCGLLVVRLRDLLGLPRPYDLAFANPLRVIPAANRFRRVHFVIPHFGAGFLRETLMAGTQCENIHVDTSSSNSWIATQPGIDDLASVFRLVLGVFGPERILFGTDSSVFPAGWRHDRFQEQRTALHQVDPSADVASLVFSENASRLLTVQESA